MPRAIDNAISSAIIDGMTKQEAIAYFGSQGKLARALGISQPPIVRWKKVPAYRQYQLEQITSGKLRMDPELVQRDPA